MSQRPIIKGMNPKAKPPSPINNSLTPPKEGPTEKDNMLQSVVKQVATFPSRSVVFDNTPEKK